MNNESKMTRQTMLSQGASPAFEQTLKPAVYTLAARVNTFMTVFCLAFGGVLLLLTFNNLFLNYRIAWNVRVNGISIGGHTVTGARQALLESVDEFKQQDIVLQTNEGDFLIRNSEFNPQLDIESAIAKAFQIGHGPDAWENTRIRAASLFRGTSIRLSYWFDRERFVRTITNKIPKLKNNQPIDATVVYAAREFKVVPGSNGLGFDEEKAVAQYDAMLAAYRPGTIPITVEPRNPDIGPEEAQRAIRHAYRQMYHQLRMYYTYDGYNYDSWGINIAEKRDWIEFRKYRTERGPRLYPILNSDALRDHLNRRIAPYMYRAKEDITIREENGRMIVDGVAKDGYYLDIPKSIEIIYDALIHDKFDSTGNYRADLKAVHLEGGIANPDNPYGLTDVLATGVTDYFGSPENRKFNLNHASERFQNVIIKPNEDFSFVRTLGLVDSTTGYLKELVIVNGDSSEPNWGGGVCQVSSTLFRTVFFAGLNVKKRTNHSYEVKYYAPTGLDATIYDPAPDLVFQNDTKNIILMQNLVDLKRTKMYFKLFGKKDGRKVTYVGPVEDGYVGEKNEHYRVYWLRQVEFADGVKNTDKFVSTYKNKDLVKKHKPDSSKIAPVDSTNLGMSVSFDSTSTQLRIIGQ